MGHKSCKARWVQLAKNDPRSHRQVPSKTCWWQDALWVKKIHWSWTLPMGQTEGRKGSQPWGHVKVPTERRLPLFWAQERAVSWWAQVTQWWNIVKTIFTTDGGILEEVGWVSTQKWEGSHQDSRQLCWASFGACPPGWDDHTSKWWCKEELGPGWWAQLKKKGVGQGIHQSDIVCVTFGWQEEANQSLEYKKNYEGYWNRELFVKQVCWINNYIHIYCGSFNH